MKKLSSLRNKADKLLTPYIISKHPHCLLKAPNCAYYTQVAHHHVHKSKSNRLRYEESNLIPLCHHCHIVLHNNESYWASKIIETKGIEWFQNLDRMKNEIVKTNASFYLEAIDRYTL